MRFYQSRKSYADIIIFKAPRTIKSASWSRIANDSFCFVPPGFNVLF